MPNPIFTGCVAGICQVGIVFRSGNGGLVNKKPIVCTGNKFENCILKCNHLIGEFTLLAKASAHTRMQVAWATQME